MGNFKIIIFKKILNIYLFFLYRAMRLSEQYKNILIGFILKHVSLNSDEYHLFNTVPRGLKYLKNKIIPQDDSSDVAIVIQGPIIAEDNFTFNTIEIFTYLFPKAKIIISTWKNQDLHIKEKLLQKNVYFVESELPSNVGTLNVNLQIISSLAGVRQADKLGCKYVLKIRSDQRITKPLSLNYLINSLNIFKIDLNERLDSRLVFLGDLTNTYTNLAFHISDFIAFGITQDVFKLYDIPLDLRPYAFKEDVLNKYKLQYDYIWNHEFDISLEQMPDYLEYNHFIEQLMSPEQYIIFEFIKNHLPFDNKDNYLYLYKDFLKRYIIILDHEDLGLYWFKNFFKYMNLNIYQRGNRYGKLNHRMWLDLYINHIKV